MKKILVMNAGSSSLKYQLYDMTDESVLAKGRVERIGMDASIIVHEPRGAEEVRYVEEILDHTAATRVVLQRLTDEQHGVIRNIEEIDAVGHRIVHGGEKFTESMLIDAQVKQEIRNLFELAPLHNPAHLTGILAMESNLPNVPQTVVFDTAFHHTMPPMCYLYPIPKVLYKKHMVRRYGFHGTSHQYVSEQAAKFLGKPLESLKIITCHIGNGASVTAIKDGKSFDTSMGMTPLEGLMMGTRSGDIDPAIVPYTIAKEELTIHEVNSMLNKHSGLMAISGLSSDMREITESMDSDPNAKLAFDMFEYRLRKYIGSYAAALNGVDVIVFTAGIGENSVVLRKQVCENLTYLGVELDEERNASRHNVERKITTDQSKVAVLVIPTNEELMIARDTYRLIQQAEQSTAQ